MNLPDCPGSPIGHCFHRDGIALLTYPPKYRKVCCHCGKHEFEQQTLHRPPGEHGKFYRE